MKDKLGKIALVSVIAILVFFTGWVFYQCYQMDIQKQKIQQVENERQKQEKEQQKTLEAVNLEVIEKEEICDVLMTNCEQVDEAFAIWLYENQKGACEAVIDAIGKGEYSPQIWYQQTGKSIYVLKDEKEGLLSSQEKMREHFLYKKECNDLDYVSLSFAGDVSFANDYAPSQNYTSMGIDGAFSEGLQKTMKDADIFMVNNEFCYSTRGTPVPKGYNFRAEPSRVSRLEEMGVDIVSIANNHAYDYGADAFLDTITTLNEANMPYVGGGSDLEDAKSHIVYFMANGMKIGYIAATQIERDTLFTQPATENSPGVVRCYEPELVNGMIAEAKKNCDFVIVYPHWGTELVETIQSDQQALAYSFIDAGADVVIGSHPHCLQGVEYYKDTPIFYSLSNFSFSGKVVKSTVLNLEITIEGIQQAKYIPCMEQGGRTNQCNVGDSDYERIIDLLNRVSVNADIDEMGVVTQEK